MKELTSLSVAWDAWRAKREGAGSIIERQQTRLRELVAYAREHSPYCAEKYQSLPERIDDIQQLPVVSKTDLMARFDSWVSDPAIKRADVEAFVADRLQIGESFLNRYLVFTTSGSSGTPAILIQEAHAQAVINGLTYVRGLSMVSLREYCSCLLFGVQFKPTLCSFYRTNGFLSRKSRWFGLLHHPAKHCS